MSVASEPMTGTFGVLPHGDYKGAPELTTPNGKVVRPFGLRFAVSPQPMRSCPPVDFANWRYDEKRQIAVVQDGKRVIEAGKHSTGPTQTPTNTGDGTRYERDDDHTED